MWRYIDKVQKPGSKRSNPETPEAAKKKRERDKLYEREKRTRKYNPAWKTHFEWLGYDEDNDVMFCILCRKYPELLSGKAGNKNVFRDGTNNFKIETIKFHNQSETHCRAASREAALNMPVGESQAEVMLEKLNQQQLDRLDKLFRSCHAIAKHSRPFTDITWMADLDEAKGLDVGTTYRNYKQAQNFINAIAQVEKNNLAAIAGKSKFISIICDGTTDASIQEAEIVFLRFATGGAVSCHFVSTEHVGKADAESISSAITQAVTRCLGDEWMSRLVALGTDGAAVMLGRNHGVAAILREKQPCLQAVHCFAHRLELAYKDGLKGIPLYSSLNSLLLNLYLFYHNSPLNRSNLKLTCAAINQKVIVPTRVGGTRWLPHLEHSLKNILTGYQGITTHLGQMQVQTGRQEQIAKAKGMLKQLQRLDIISYAHFMWDIVLVLKHLSLTCQGRETTIGDVFQVLEATMATLKKYKDRSTPKEKAVTSVEDEGSTFGGQTLVGATMAASTRRATIEKLEQALTNRFIDCEKQVVLATSFVTFATWPKKEDNDDFGENSIQILTKHYETVLHNSGVDTDAIPIEWSFLKTELYGRPEKVQTLNWQQVNDAYKESGRFNNILALVDLVLCMPASSADAERGFSQMKLVKTKLRSRLRADHLTDLLTIQLHTPDVKEFDPKPAINLWLKGSSTRSRRPNTGYVFTRPDCYEESYPYVDSESDSSQSEDEPSSALQLDYESADTIVHVDSVSLTETTRE